MQRFVALAFVVAAAALVLFAVAATAAVALRTVPVTTIAKATTSRAVVSLLAKRRCDTSEASTPVTTDTSTTESGCVGVTEFTMSTAAVAGIAFDLSATIRPNLDAVVTNATSNHDDNGGSSASTQPVTVSRLLPPGVDSVEALYAPLAATSAAAELRERARGAAAAAGTAAAGIATVATRDEPSFLSLVLSRAFVETLHAMPHVVAAAAVARVECNAAAFADVLLATGGAFARETCALLLRPSPPPSNASSTPMTVPSSLTPPPSPFSRLAAVPIDSFNCDGGDSDKGSDAASATSFARSLRHLTMHASSSAAVTPTNSTFLRGRFVRFVAQAAFIGADDGGSGGVGINDHAGCHGMLSSSTSCMDASTTTSIPAAATAVAAAAVALRTAVSAQWLSFGARSRAHQCDGDTNSTGELPLGRRLETDVAFVRVSRCSAGDDGGSVHVDWEETARLDAAATGAGDGVKIVLPLGVVAAAAPTTGVAESHARVAVCVAVTNATLTAAAATSSTIFNVKSTPPVSPPPPTSSRDAATAAALPPFMVAAACLAAHSACALYLSRSLSPHGFHRELRTTISFADAAACAIACDGSVLFSPSRPPPPPLSSLLSFLSLSSSSSSFLSWFSLSSSSAACELIVVETLPAAVYADVYELADRWRLGVGPLTAAAAPFDLEAPAALSSHRTLIVRAPLLSLASSMPPPPPLPSSSSSSSSSSSPPLLVPLHLRYGVPSAAVHGERRARATVPAPLVFLSCLAPKVNQGNEGSGGSGSKDSDGGNGDRKGSGDSEAASPRLWVRRLLTTTVATVDGDVADAHGVVTTTAPHAVTMAHLPVSVPVGAAVHRALVILVTLFVTVAGAVAISAASGVAQTQLSTVSA